MTILIMSIKNNIKWWVSEKTLNKPKLKPKPNSLSQTKWAYAFFQEVYVPFLDAYAT